MIFQYCSDVHLEFPVNKKYLKANALTERLSQVRDIFVFCCYTGLAYADVQKLRRVDIVIGNDGEKWIHTERVKTETPNPHSAFASSYEDHGYL